MFKNGFNDILLLSLMITLCSDAKSYTQISSYGSGSQDSGPRIFKTSNSDIVIPQTYNSSNYVTTQIPLITTTSTAIPVHYPKDSVSDTAMPTAPAAPVIYVTPPSQTSFTPETRNGQTMAANQMQVGAQSDYAKQLLREETYGNIQTNDNQQLSSTGRAVDYRPAYQLDQFMNVAKPYTTPLRPYVLQPTTRYPIRSHKGQATQYNGINVRPYQQSSYPQHQRPQQLLRRPPSQAEVYKLNGRGQFSDRFTPGEAVASALFTKNAKKHGHNHNHGNKVAASSNLMPSYALPKDLYSFPPNINAKYPRPSEDAKAALASINANSYVPPPAGPIKTQADYPLTALASSNEGYKYSGPVNPAYLPPSNGQGEKTKEETIVKPSESNSADSDSVDNDDTIGVLPASAMDADDTGNKVPNEESDMKEMDDLKAMQISDDDHDHDHDHSADHPPMTYDSDKEYPTPPPGWMEEHPEHGHGPSFPYFSHHFPEIIYDDHHHDFHHDFHHDHHHPVEPPLPTTTIPPPPDPLPSEQPQEPRVKKYSYFYIGRKLWYIPLYFTVWFSFYVLWLILKSIARHKVNLPNHYVAKRSLPNDLDKKAKEHINDLTIYVLQNIENFQRKYIT